MHLPKTISRGFSLIELMVTVSVVAILGALATTSDQSVMAKGDRATAISDIVEIAQSLERYYSFNRTYTNDFTNIAMSSASDATIEDAQGLYTYHVVIPGTAITIGTTNAAAAQAVINDNNSYLSYTIYAVPNAKNRDKWILSFNELGFKYHFASAASPVSDKTAVDGWPH